MEVAIETTSYNLNVMVILSEPLKLNDIIKRMEKTGIELYEIMPTYPIPLQNPFVSIGYALPGIRLTRIMDTYLFAYNLQYPDQVVRGVLALRAQNVKISETPEPHYTQLVDLINKLGYQDKVLFYEIGINFEAKTTPFLDAKHIFPDLQTIKDPKFFTIRIFDGQVSDKDLREEPWSEIHIEPLITNPKKIFVNATYRKKEYDENLINKILMDIQKIFRRLEQTND